MPTQYNKQVKVLLTEAQYERVMTHAKSHAKMLGNANKPSMTAFMRYCLEFTMNHPSHPDRVRRKLAFICTKLEDRLNQAIDPADVMYKALDRYEKSQDI